MTDWIADTLYSNGVMKNRYHIHNQKQLEQREFLLSARNAIIFLQQQPKITNIRDLKKIHKIMFGQLYDWAGKYRIGNFQKNGYEFFDYRRFDFAEKNINEIIAQQPKNIPLPAIDYAKLLDSINFMHPFREGNGRSCKVFLLAYAANHQQTIDYPRKNEEMIVAQNEANIEKIAKLLKIEDTPTREAAFEQLIKQRQTEAARK